MKAKITKSFKIGPKVFGLLGLLIFISACDFVSKPPDTYFFAKDTIQNLNNDTILDTNSIKKVVLLEFTGIRCTNCPDAHQIIHQIENSFENQFLTVSFHGTSLARPIGEFADQPDLRTPEGNEIIEDFGINAIPVGAVDFFDKNHLKYKEDWFNEVQTFISENPKIKISISNCFCNNSLNSTINVQTLDNLQGNFKLCVFIVEDSIITKQASNDGIIENYVQMNVFRTSLTNTYGNLIFSNSTPKYFFVSKTFKFNFPENWIPNHCRVVAFVYDDNSKKILNAQSKPVLE